MYVNINGSMACGCSDVTNQECQYDVNECTSDPCLNRGVFFFFFDRINGYECECRNDAYDDSRGGFFWFSILKHATDGVTPNLVITVQRASQTVTEA